MLGKELAQWKAAERDGRQLSGILFPWPVRKRECEPGGSLEVGDLLSSQHEPLSCPEMVKVAEVLASAEEKFPCPCLSEWLGLK